MKNYVLTAWRYARTRGLSPAQPQAEERADLTPATQGNPPSAGIHIFWLDLRRSTEIIVGHIRPSRESGPSEPDPGHPAAALHVPGSGPGRPGTPYWGIWSLN